MFSEGRGSPSANPEQRVVPPTGFTAHLTFLSAAAMAFLAVFALALSFSAGRLAERWATELALSATIRISAPQSQIPDQARAAMKVLETTPGIASARVLDKAEQEALLEPWLGPGLPLDALPLPRLIEVIAEPGGFDAEGLRQRLAAEAPGAVLDDHARWRRPLVNAARRLEQLGWLSIILITLTMGAVITLAAQAALAANAQVISVLRLIGAKDAFIVAAFVRRFTLRAVAGAALGTGAGMLAIALLPETGEAGGVLTGLGFHGAGWLWPLAIPLLAGFVAFWATRLAAFRCLKELT